MRAGGHTSSRTPRFSSSLALTSQSSARPAPGSRRSSGLLLGWHRPAVGRALLVDGMPLDAAQPRRAAPRDSVGRSRRPALESIARREPRVRQHASAPASARASRRPSSWLIEQLPDGLQTTLGEGGTLVSGGEGQRVRFGRGLGRPDARLVILDEPFRGLERNSRATLLRRARERWPRATIVCVTHDISETATFDRVSSSPTAGSSRTALRRLSRLRRVRAIAPCWTRRPGFASGCGRIPRGGRCDSRTEGSCCAARRRIRHEHRDVDLADPSGRGITKAAGGRLSGIAAVCWPSQRAPEGLELLARAARLPLPTDSPASEAEPRAQDVDASLEGGRRARARGRAVDAAFGEIGRAACARPGRQSFASARTRLVMLVRRRGRRLTIVGPDHRVVAVRVETLRRALVDPEAAPLVADTERLVDEAGVRAANRSAVASALVEERLRARRLRGVWLLRIPSGGSFRAQLVAAGGRRQLVLLALAHAAPVRTLDRRVVAAGAGGAAGPARCGVARGVDARAFHAGAAAAVWRCGSRAGWRSSAGALLKQRLLAGAFRLEPEEIRREGAGQLLGRVIEAEAVESLALGGGLHGVARRAGAGARCGRAGAHRRSWRCCSLSGLHRRRARLGLLPPAPGLGGPAHRPHARFDRADDRASHANRAAAARTSGTRAKTKRSNGTCTRRRRWIARPSGCSRSCREDG